MNLFIFPLFFSLLFALWPMNVVADLEDSSNISYDKSTVKHKAKRTVRNSTCYYYIDIFGNKDWNKLKNTLNEVVEQNPNCKKLIIYKIIKNVHTTERSQKLKGYDYNLGIIVRDLPNVEIETVTIVEHSDISTGFFKSNINSGVQIEENSNFFGKKINNKTIIKDSNVGKNFLID